MSNSKIFNSMKNAVILLVAVLTGTFGLKAASEEATHFSRGYGNSFIFVENGITFSVYPDGEFDFYIDQAFEGRVNVHGRRGSLSLTFNSGYDYSPYVQYDDYGAVIQVENVPIYYDYYGRVSRIGDVDIYYDNRRLYRVGGLYVHYDSYGVFSHCTGYINPFNRRYVYYPYHRYFVRPAVSLCLVSYNPYRRYYAPVRYTYYKPYVNNYRRTYAKVGREYRYNSRNSRRTTYVNDRRVTERRSTYHRDRRDRLVQNDMRSGLRNRDASGKRREISRKTNSERNARVRTDHKAIKDSRTVTDRRDLSKKSSGKQRSGITSRSDSRYENASRRTTRSQTQRSERPRVNNSKPVRNSTRAGRTVQRTERSHVRQHRTPVQRSPMASTSRKTVNRSDKSVQTRTATRSRKPSANRSSQRTQKHANSRTGRGRF